MNPLTPAVAEIIAIGSELTTGAKLDTNSQWLSLQLGEVGIPVHYHCTMADDLEAMVSVFRQAVERSDLVLITGGLGPTLDDLTRQAMADLAGVELVVDEPSMKFLEDLFARRFRKMAERNRQQAMFPAGSEPLPNPRGTAPGIWQTVERNNGRGTAIVAAMPGVPSEMKRMFQYELLPRLGVGVRVIQRARINCFGKGESDIEELLGDLTSRGRDPEIGITAHQATITMRISAQGNSVDECQRKILDAKSAINEQLGLLVFGEEDEELQDILLPLMNGKGVTLSTAESGTGGLLAHCLTDVPNHSKNYLGGLIAPTDAAKIRMLNLSPELLKSAGSISREVTQVMAENCRKIVGTDYALAITECPAYNPDDLLFHSPSTWIALAGPDDFLKVVEHQLIGDLAILKSRAAKTAMNLLRLHLLQDD